MNLRAAKAERFGEGNFLMVAYTDTFESQIGYYLASVFDEIRAEPMSSLPLFGFGSAQPFFRNLLDRLKIQVRTFTREQYKSVLSNVQGTEYSPEIKANMLSLFSNLNEQFVAGIAQGRAGRLRLVDHDATMTQLEKGQLQERGEPEVSDLYAIAAQNAKAGVPEHVLEAIKASAVVGGHEPRSLVKDGPITGIGASFFPAHAFLTEQEMEESVGFVRKIIDRGPMTAKEALKAGFIDVLKYRRDIVDWFLGDVWEGQVRSKAREEMGAPWSLGGIILPTWGPKKDHVNTMSIYRYKVARDYELARNKKRWFPNPLVPAKGAGAIDGAKSQRLNVNRMVVGLVYLTGNISRGDGPGGGNHVVKAMSEAARDNDVEVVVLRIDSGGGDALASDTIWEAVKNVRESTGKPVVASMGNVCASGGYYAASGADKIIAMPGTITGSIGVASLRPWLTPEFLDKFGVTTDDVMTTDSAKFASIFHDLDAKEIERTERSIESMYRVFRKRVADARGWSELPEEERERKLDAVTGGRVFSGEQAKENGLVDELGGTHAAIAAAVDLGLRARTTLLPDKVRDVLNQLATAPEPEVVDVRIYPVQKSWLSFLSADNESIEENLVSLGRTAASTLASWFVGGNGLWEMEKMMLEAGDRAEKQFHAGRGSMEADIRVSL
ncbi:hypothetical protein DFJ74DRAFT_656211 [Hyaloraphidium curvatum]|nr:hypothetical protein DFJ74DRAFT_656211 [Hyaloraphidium curvatum]